MPHLRLVQSFLLAVKTYSKFKQKQRPQFSSVQSLSHVWLFATPWIAARQASLSITISRSSLRLASIESVMPSSHLILGRPLLLQPPIPSSIRVFSTESTLRMRWPKYRSFSFSIIPSKEIPGLISFRMDWLAVKNLPAMQETQEMWVWSLGWEDSLEKGMATHFSIFAWRIQFIKDYIHGKVSRKNLTDYSFDYFLSSRHVSPSEILKKWP